MGKFGDSFRNMFDDFAKPFDGIDKVLEDAEKEIEQAVKDGHAVDTTVTTEEKNGVVTKVTKTTIARSTGVKRIATEQEKQRREHEANVRKAAFAKLTDEERRALGLKYGGEYVYIKS